MNDPRTLSKFRKYSLIPTLSPLLKMAQVPLFATPSPMPSVLTYIMNGPSSSTRAAFLRNKWISNTWWILNLGNLELSVICCRNLCGGQFACSRQLWGMSAHDHHWKHCQLQQQYLLKVIDQPKKWKVYERKSDKFDLAIRITSVTWRYADTKHLKKVIKVKKVKWCIYIAPFPCNMLKGALQWSVYPQRTGSIYRRLWQPLQIGPCMLVLILPTPGGWKAEWTLAGKKVTQIFNPRPGRESNRGPQDWEAEILTTAPTPIYRKSLN